MSHPVLARLASPSPLERRAACAEAADDPSAVLLVDALADALADADAGVARAAGDALQRLGRSHDAVLTALRGALLGETARQRLEAAWTWARLEPPPIALLPAVAGALHEALGDARWRAARLLVELGRLHGEVLPVVAGLAGSDHPPRARRIALAALRELAPGDPACLAAHLAACRSDDAGLRRLALGGLAGLGVRTPEVWALLGEALGDGDAGSRRAAVLAIAALGEPPEALRAALDGARSRDADPAVRAHAERALAREGSG